MLWNDDLKKKLRAQRGDGIMPKTGSPNWFMEFTHKGQTVRRTSRVAMGDTLPELKVSYAEAVKVAKAERDKIDEEQKSGVKAATLGFALERYFNDVIKPKLKPSKEKPDFKKKSQRILDYFGDGELLTDITAVKIGLWKSSMLAGGRKVHVGNGLWKTTEQPLAVRSVNAHLAALRSVLTKAATDEWGYLVKCPEFEPVKGAKKKLRYLEREEAAALIKAALPDKSANTDSLHLQQLVRFLLATGARKHEAFDLTWARVDLTNNHGGSVFFDVTKTEQPREVPIGDSLRDMLIDMKAEQTRRGYTGKKVFVYFGSQGPEEIDGVSSSFLTARRKANLGNDVTLHTLRHTCASWLLQDGEPLKNVSERLGHKSITLTADTYGHIKPKHLRPGVSLLEKRMEETMAMVA